MAKCNYCGTSIIFGGKRQGELRFCNEKCALAGRLLTASQQVPNDLVMKRVSEIHQGNCPECQGRGPVDVYMSYQVWSAVLLTSWKTRPHICCRSCGIKSQLGDTAFSLVLGWWGIPWGFIFTPIQVIRNLIAIARGTNPSSPSAELDRLVRLQVASEVARRPPQAANRTAARPFRAALKQREPGGRSVAAVVKD
jgi:hypothetical protein